MNPGPTTEQLLAELLSGQNWITAEITALGTQQDNMQELMTDWNLRFTELEKRVAKADTLEKTIVSLQVKITDLEDRSRRSNVVVFGIEEHPAETKNDFRQKVFTEIFTDKLRATCSSVGRIHRIGRPGKTRPVIVFFQEFNEKEQTLTNAKHLMETNVSIENDYSKETLRKRKLLWDAQKIKNGKEKGFSASRQT